MMSRTNDDHAKAREAVAQFLEEHRVPERIRFDVQLAVGEASANAMSYGEGGNVVWRLSLGRGRILFEMEYRSQPFRTEAAPQDFEHPSEHGRGILLMRALTDDVEYKFSRGMVHLSMMKKLTIP